MTKPIDIADVRARLAAPILGRAQPDPFDLTVHHRHPRIATIRFAPGRPIGYALSASYPDWTDRSFLAQRLAGMRLFFGALRDIEPGLDGTCDLWLGDVPEAPGLAFSGCASSNVLVPDPDFVASDGYRQLRREAEGMLPWPERENDLFWRGTLSGDPKRRAPGWRTLQRARLCLAGRASVVGVPLDAKLVGTRAMRRAPRDGSRSATSACSQTGSRFMTSRATAMPSTSTAIPAPGWGCSPSS